MASYPELHIEKAPPAAPPPGSPASRTLELLQKKKHDIVFSPGRSVFIYHASGKGSKKVSLSGLHRVIERTFMDRPLKEFHQSLQQQKIPIHKDNTGFIKGTTLEMSGCIDEDVPDSRGCYYSDSKQHGSLVDKQINIFGALGGDMQKFIEKVPKPDQCVITLIKYLQQKRYTPVQSQVIVGFPDMGMATAMDLLCRDRHGNLIVIEIKATRHTCSNYYHHKQGKLCAPLDLVPMSLLNLDILQLVLTVRMFQHYFMVPVSNAHLIRLSGQGLTDYGLTAWAKNETVMRRVEAHLRSSYLHAENAKSKKRRGKALQRDRFEKRTKLHRPRSVKSRGGPAYFGESLDEL